MTAQERAPWWAAHQQFPERQPLISGVLAVGMAGDFLPRRPDSIPGQPGPPAGPEVIAINGASPPEAATEASGGGVRTAIARGQAFVWGLATISPSHHG